MRRLLSASPLLTIVLFFLLFTSDPLWDPDFFSHLKSGEYIAQQKEIPKEDMFSYTAPKGETLRKNFFLRQYWLSQLIFYFVWKQAGIEGIIILRALLLSLPLLLMYFLLRKRIDPLLLSVIIFLSGNVFLDFTGERPQLFSFLGAAVLIFIIERYKETKGKILYLLPFVTLLWANLHGGVILGNALLIIYIFSEGAKFFLKLDPLEKREYIRLLLFCAAAVVMSLINPNTYHLFTAFYQFSKSISPQISIEFLSPLAIALGYKKIFLGYFLMIALIILLIPLVLFAKGRKADMSHVALVIFLCIISLKSARYMIFLAIMFPVLASDVGHLIKDRFKGIKLLTGISVIIFMLYAIYGKGAFSFRIHENYPDKAVGFIKKTQPSGNLFNYFDWGCYLIYALPEYKVFIDGRGLDEDAQVKYNLIISGSTMRHGGKYEWERMLDNYGIGIVLLPLYDFNTKKTIRLVELLLNHPQWRAFYLDEKSIVFLRRQI